LKKNTNSVSQNSWISGEHLKSGPSNNTYLLIFMAGEFKVFSEDVWVNGVIVTLIFSSAIDVDKRSDLRPGSITLGKRDACHC
jgi:hypothetical protein